MCYLHDLWVRCYDSCIESRLLHSQLLSRVYDCFSLFPLSPSFTISFWFVFNHWKKNISCSHHFLHTLFVIRVWLSIQLSVNKKNIFCVVSLVFPLFTICDSWLIFFFLDDWIFYLKKNICCARIISITYVYDVFLIIFLYYTIHDSYFLLDDYDLIWRRPIGFLAFPVMIHEWSFIDSWYVN